MYTEGWQTEEKRKTYDDIKILRTVYISGKEKNYLKMFIQWKAENKKIE